MKYQGKELHNDYTQFVVIPRPDQDVVFKIKPVDQSHYEDIEPRPEPPFSQLKGQSKMFRDFEDPDYIREVDAWSKRKSAWIVIESLRESEIEWDTVDLRDPTTFGNYQKELEDAGFSPVEFGEIFNTVIQVNGLSAEGIKRATQDFLASLAEQQNS